MSTNCVMRSAVVVEQNLTTGVRRWWRVTERGIDIVEVDLLSSCRTGHPDGDPYFVDQSFDDYISSMKSRGFRVIPNPLA